MLKHSEGNVMATRSADQAKAELRRKGVSVTGWAKANNLCPVTVFQLLAGRLKGTRGESHRAAVLLGMKDGAVIEANQVKNALAPTNARRAA